MPYNKSFDEKGPAFLLLKEKRFLLFFITVFLSNIGNWLHNLALSWLSLSLINTPSSFSFITFLGSIPNLIFSFVGGYIADNLDKRLSLIYCQLIAMISAIFIGLGIIFNLISYSKLAILTFITGITTAISYPVYYTLMTELVEIKNLPRAISIHSLQFNLSRMIGPLIFGLLISLVGLAGCFLINALSFIPFLFILFRVREKKREEKVIKESFLDNIKSGLSYIYRDKSIFYSIITIFVYSLLVLPYIGIMPYIVKNFLEDNPKTLSLAMGTIGVGSICGAIIISFISREIITVFKRFIISGFLFSISLGFLAYSKNLWLFLLFAFLLGLLMVFFYASANSFLQMWAREDVRGRVVGLFTTVYLGVYPIGTIIIGLLGEYFSLKDILFINSAISFLILSFQCILTDFLRITTGKKL